MKKLFFALLSAIVVAALFAIFAINFSYAGVHNPVGWQFTGSNIWFNGWVGIGTNPPSAPLDIGTMNGDGVSIRLPEESSIQWGVDMTLTRSSSTMGSLNRDLEIANSTPVLFFTDNSGAVGSQDDFQQWVGSSRMEFWQKVGDATWTTFGVASTNRITWSNLCETADAVVWDLFKVGGTRLAWVDAEGDVYCAASFYAGSGNTPYAAVRPGYVYAVSTAPFWGMVDGTAGELDLQEVLDSNTYTIQFGHGSTFTNYVDFTVDRFVITNLVTAANTVAFNVVKATGPTSLFRVDAEGDVEHASMVMRESTSQPADPAEGSCVIWMSNGTGYGDDGDLCIVTQAGGTVYTNTIVNVVP